MLASLAGDEENAVDAYEKASYGELPVGFGEKPGIIARPDHPRAESGIEVPDVVVLGLRSFVRAGGANDVSFHVSSRDDL